MQVKNKKGAKFFKSYMEELPRLDNIFIKVMLW